MTQHYHVIIPDPTNASLLMGRTEAGYALPHFEMAERHFWQTVDHVNRAIQEQLGITVTTVRCLKVMATHRYYAMESHSPEWTPPDGMEWIAHEQLNEVTLEQPEQRVIIEEWITWSEHDQPQRADWYQPGWFGAASAWMKGRLQEQGMDAIGPVEQLRAWERSAILRAGTNQGQVYFKALPPIFRHEHGLTLWLGRLFPQNVATVLAFNPARRWMLMADHGSQTLDALPEIERWEAALRRFAEIQRGVVARTKELTELGVPDRRLYWLESHMDSLLNLGAEQLSGDVLKLTEDEVQRLRERIPKFKQICTELVRYGIPASLEHGDFWAGQVIVQDDRYVFIDWSDASVSHPFFSLLFLHDDDAPLPDVVERLRNAYLEPWRAYEPMDKLIEAYELARQIAPLHYALLYHQRFLPGMEIKWEMGNMIPFYLRMLLASA
jgi:hypothetical protein